MNRIFVSGILLFASLMAAAPETATFQNAAQLKATISFATVPKTINAQLKLADGSNLVANGRATFTVTQANTDDTVTGTLVYALPDDVRKKIAESSGKTLSSIPPNVSLKELTAVFQRGTACPQVKLSVAAKDAELAGAQLHFDRVVLHINETPEPMSQLFCSWTRQINVKRQRQGIIAAINRLLIPPAPDEEAVENKPVKP